MLLSPRLLAGPVAGSSALSRSVALHLLFGAWPRFCRPYGKDGLLEPPGVCSSLLTPAPLGYAPFASPLGGPVVGSSALSRSVARHLLFVPRRAYVAHMAMMVCWSRGRLH